MILLACLCLSAHAQQNEWTWMGGSSTVNQPGVYGALGTPAAGNISGGRYGATNWTDNSGHLWLFGGISYDANSSLGDLNDLWEFNPQTNEWAWIGGSNTRLQPGVYGTLGTPAAGNIPGGRDGASSWTDSSGHLWLFGGGGWDANRTGGYLNDLWEFNPSTNEWAWMGGSSTLICTIDSSGYGECALPGVYGTLGTPATGNIPGSRYYAMSWTDSSGNFWLFGGMGFDANETYGYLNDLWEFNPSTKEWAWMGGNSTVPCSDCGQPGVYGTLGTPAAGNIPGSRVYAASWTDSSGHLWLFGGNGYDANGNMGMLNDLWEFNPSTNQWTWMGGSNTVPCKFCGLPGVYGTMGVPAAGNLPGSRQQAVSWTDSSGNFWLFGGLGYGANGNEGGPSDLWEFNPSTNQWAWMGGSSTVPCNGCGHPGMYGTLGTPAAGNIPGGRYGAVNWTDSSGNFWLFGGHGLNANGNWGLLNDLWEYQLLASAATPTFSMAAGTYTTIQTVSISDATPGATIYYTLDGSTPTTSSTVYSGAITVSSSETISAIASVSGYTTSAVASATYTITPPAATPTFSVPAGTYIATPSVTISDATPGAIIYFTTNGTTPTTSSSVYSASITVSSSETLEAIAVAPGYSASAVTSAAYTIAIAAPSVPGEWTWMGGSSTMVRMTDGTYSQLGVYGTLGTPAAGNIPGGRWPAASWTDSSGNLWLFGGVDYDANGNMSISNDLWEFNPSTNQWAWKGGNSDGWPGVYGTLGRPAAGNIPVGRENTTSWTDSNGHLWLFGGDGIFGYLNDLWEFNPATNEWAWMGGSSKGDQPGVYGTLGTPASGNIPGGREWATSWTDSSGHFWLFGGQGYDVKDNLGLLNDLWEFNPSTNKWAWMGGSSTVPPTNCGLAGVYCGQAGVYGTLGTPAAANIPGGRVGATSWTDSSGNLWLFGGGNYMPGVSYSFFNDLWEFNPSTNQWAWMSGSSTMSCWTAGNGSENLCGQPGVYGVLGTSAAGNIPGSREYATSWTDSSGHFWLFGGWSYDANGNFGWFNDLWEFNPSTNQWAWMGGSSTAYQPGVYGTLGTPAAGNIPGSRTNSASWTDSSGNFWLFGGWGEDANRNMGCYLNDLWKYQPASSTPASTTTTIASSPNHSVYGQAVTFTANVTSSAGAPPNGETVTFMNGATALGTGTLTSGTTSFTTSALPAGSYSITAAYGGDSNFAGSTSSTMTLIVNPATLTVTANNVNMTAGAAVPTLTVSYSGFVNGDTAAVLSRSPALSTTATNSSPAGTYPITVTQGTLTAANYTFTFVNGTLSVVAPPTVVLSTTATLTKVSGSYQATVTITNTGTGPTSNVQLTTATLGSATGSPLPQSLGTLAAGGGSATVTVTFPASAGNDGARVVESYAGTSTGANFTASMRAVLP